MRLASLKFIFLFFTIFLHHPAKSNSLDIGNPQPIDLGYKASNFLLTQMAHFCQVASYGAKYIADFLNSKSQAISPKENDEIQNKSSKEKLIIPQIKERFDSIGGLTEEKEELQDIVNFLKNPEKYAQLGAKMPKIIALVGDPGNGKTLLAKAFIGESDCAFYPISASDLNSCSFKDVLERAKDILGTNPKKKQAIILINKLETFAPSMAYELISEINKIEHSDKTVIFVITINRPEILNDVSLRPNSFFKLIKIPYPNLTDRKEILQIHSKTFKISQEVDFVQTAKKTDGFSGLQLANLVNEAAIIASKFNKSFIDTKDFDEALKFYKPQKTIISPNEVKERFGSIGGLNEAKEELHDIVDFLKNPKKYTKLGAKIPKIIIFSGPPGNGKFLLAKALSGEASCAFYSINVADFDSPSFRSILENTNEKNPAIIFINKFETLSPSIAYDLFAKINKIEYSNKIIIFVISVSKSGFLSDTSLQPNLFFKYVHIPYPDLSDRKEILQIQAKNFKIAPDVNLTKIAQTTGGFSGIELENLINEAAINASKSNSDTIGTKDFENALDRIKFGESKKTNIWTEQEKKIIAYHEVGHTVAHLLASNRTHSYTLRKVTIGERNNGSLGMNVWDEIPNKTYSKEDFLADIQTVLGGRAAEEIVFNKLTTGACDDLKKATNKAMKMVCDYGMSEKLGLVVYQQFNSPEITTKIYEEVQNIINSCYKNVRQLLIDNKTKLNKLANALLEKETLYLPEICGILEIKIPNNSMD